MLITAFVYGLAALVTIWLLKERAQQQAAPAGSTALGAWRRSGRTWHEARRFGDFSWLLSCALFYQSGISVVIALAAVYAGLVLGFEQTDTMMLIFLVNIAAALGAWALGHWQDRIGHRRALAGLCMGSSQSAGRATAVLLAPADRMAEFFGLWTVPVRLSAIVGPTTYGLVTLATGGNHRIAILSQGCPKVPALRDGADSAGLSSAVPQNKPTR